LFYLQVEDQSEEVESTANEGDDCQVVEKDAATDAAEGDAEAEAKAESKAEANAESKAEAKAEVS